MIGYLKGEIIYKDLKFLIVNTGNTTNGVGYKVYTTPDVVSEIEPGGYVDLWVHTVVKDDAIDLYGFKTKGSLDFFDLLLSVSGIGPKSALNILGLANTTNLRRAIVSQDISYLTNISGISKKIAEKIVMELKGKILGNDDDGGDGSDENGLSSYNKQNRSVETETIEALKSLGYTPKEAREAFENVSKEIKDSKDVGQIIKATLKMLS